MTIFVSFDDYDGWVALVLFVWWVWLYYMDIFQCLVGNGFFFYVMDSRNVYLASIETMNIEKKMKRFGCNSSPAKEQRTQK